ncbi:hypothetical protein BDR22DRAFT_893659 [Usnea florida]
MVSQVLRDSMQRWRAQKYTPVAKSEGEETFEESRHGLTVSVKVSQQDTHRHIELARNATSRSLALHPFWPGSLVASSNLCKEPPIRREWRSLTLDEKSEFIQAVNCLSTKPSRWGMNGTLYDDFALLHGSIGSWCHRSASFFPWHRYTLKIWETALRDECGFKSQLPYWDWSLDWMDLANSSIWNSSDGFGGDGDLDGPVTVGGGRCVTNGPFSALRPIIYNHTYTQHCLSRGFRDGKTVGRIPGARYSPESIGSILRESTYKEFVRRVEYYLHNTMHQGIAGDFLAMTAANDPVFFVHHVQLDRLWWRWQQEDLDHRIDEYRGKHMYNSTGEASTSDILMYAGFAEDIPVSQVMDTQGGFLCYRY